MNRLVNGRQLASWFTLYYLGSAILLVPSAIATEARQDAWLSVLAAALMHAPILLLCVLAGKLMKGESMESYLSGVLGKWAAKAVLLLFSVLFPYFIYILTLRNMGDFLTTTILRATPIEAIHMVMAFTVAYAVFKGAAAIGRAASIVFPLVMLLFAVLLISLLTNSNWDHFLPVLEFGVVPVIRGSMLLAAFPYVETVIFLALLPHLQEGSNLTKLMLKSSVTSIVLFLFTVMVVLMVFGPGVTELLVYPTYFTAKTVSIGHFYERIESVVSILWYVTIFFRMSLLLFVTSESIACIFGLSSRKPLVIPLTMIGIVMAEVVWPNTAFLYGLFRVWPYYAFPIGIGMPLLLLGAGYWRSRKGREASL